MLGMNRLGSSNAIGTRETESRKYVQAETCRCVRVYGGILEHPVFLFLFFSCFFFRPRGLSCRVRVLDGKIYTICRGSKGEADGAVTVGRVAHNMTHFLSPLLLYRLSSGMVSRRPGAAPLAGLIPPPGELAAAFCRRIILTTS